MTFRALTIFLTLAVVVPPATAHGGTFEFDVCRPPGRPQAGTEGWQVLNSRAGFRYDLYCDDGTFGVTTQNDGANYAAGSASGWQYSLPPGLRITGYSGIWMGSSAPFSTWGWAYGLNGRKPGEPGWVNVGLCGGAAVTCGPGPEMATVPPMQDIAVVVQCIARGTCPAGSYAAVEVHWLRFRVEDDGDPIIVPTGGALTSTAPVTGTVSVDFQANDEGSGVRSVGLEVDGQVVATEGFTSPSAKCTLPYTGARPCLATVAGSLALDTTKLYDGSHRVRLIARDATETNLGATTPWALASANRTKANLCHGGLGASAQVRQTPRVLRFGNGGAISLSWPAMPWRPAEGVVFEGDGVLSATRPMVQRTASRLVAELPPGHSRTVVVGVRPAGTQSPYVCSKPIPVKVHAGLSLRAWPRDLANGERLSLHGRLAGGAIARSRSVVIEARAEHGRRHWSTVSVVKTAVRGRFSYAYRFTRTSQPTAFIFRARIGRERGFPFEPAASPARRVVVGGY
jgi:hypothetical protein